MSGEGVIRAGSAGLQWQAGYNLGSRSRRQQGSPPPCPSAVGESASLGGGQRLRDGTTLWLLKRGPKPSATCMYVQGLCHTLGDTRVILRSGGCTDQLWPQSLLEPPNPALWPKMPADMGRWQTLVLTLHGSLSCTPAHHQQTLHATLPGSALLSESLTHQSP